jgi:hypothetical protein
MKDDWRVLLDNFDLPAMPLEKRAAAIAAELYKGHPSRTFCQMLAGMISGEKNATKLRLTLGWDGRGQPRRPNVELGKAMVVATEGVPRGQVKAAKKDVAKRYGVSLRTAETAMADEIHHRDLWQLVDAKRKEKPE